MPVAAIARVWRVQYRPETKPNATSGIACTTWCRTVSVTTPTICNQMIPHQSAESSIAAARRYGPSSGLALRSWSVLRFMYAQTMTPQPSVIPPPLAVSLGCSIIKLKCDARVPRSAPCQCARQHGGHTKAHSRPHQDTCRDGSSPNATEHP
jgi:hypothetical protein